MLAWLVMTVALAAAGPLAAGQDAILARARDLAGADRRADAIALLQDSLKGAPDNTDARTLLGTVLSWEGRYDEGRRELEVVLASRPDHADALAALVNVELWSGHPERAEQLASRALRHRPNDPVMLLARARALDAMSRPAEARDLLDRVMVIDPRNDQAREMRRGIREQLRLWQIRIGGSHDRFSGDRVAWREATVSLARATPIGSIGIVATRAERFGLNDHQFEVEAYPRFRPGTYAYIAAAYAPNAILFPTYRYAVDLSQSVGAGFEASGGFRRLGFGTGSNIYVGSLSKYYGQWLFTGRVFATPNSAAGARSYQASVRRYVGGHGTYVGARYGRGSWREEVRNLHDLGVLDSDVGAAEATIVLRRRLELRVSVSYGREDRVEQTDQRQYSLSTGIGFRF
jgi:YaiO family outer membrane protein